MEEDSIYDRPPDQDELDEILRALTLKGFVDARMVNGELCYRITELGKEVVQQGREQFYRDNPDIP